jgi:hypothetical protein
MDEITQLPPAPPPLTRHEETFLLALVQAGNDDELAYSLVYGKDDNPFPKAAVAAFKNRPEVQQRMREMVSADKTHEGMLREMLNQKIFETSKLANELKQPKTAMDGYKLYADINGLMPTKEDAKRVEDVSVYINIGGRVISPEVLKAERARTIENGAPMMVEQDVK